MTRINREMV
ncbi:hypothetical protein LINGRAHAP2_LOCUS36393 [Linum grandiflorum]